MLLKGNSIQNVKLLAVKGLRDLSLKDLKAPQGVKTTKARYQWTMLNVPLLFSYLDFG